MKNENGKQGIAEVPQLADGMRVVLVGDGRWVGTFAEFVLSNVDGFTLREIELISETLLDGRRYQFGGGSGPVFTLRREPTTTEILRTAADWLAMLPGYNVRLVGLSEPLRAGDFQLTSNIKHGGYHALYVGPCSLEVCETPANYLSDGNATLFFRYTRQLFTDEPNVYADAGEDEVLAALDEQCELLALAERKKFGKRCGAITARWKHVRTKRRSRRCGSASTN
jgi:hypothetical protein